MARKSRKAPEGVQPTESRRVFSAAIYARLSVENSGKDDDGAALETQTEVCREFISGCPYLQLTDIYADNGRTGTVFDRPGFNALMDDVRGGRIDCIVVRDLSRFGRDYIETGTYLERIFPQLGVRFISVKENYDSFTSDSESLTVPLQNLINDLYSKDISRKVSAALHAQMENGAFRWRKVPCGYRWNGDRTNIVPDEETAELVRSMFRWRSEGVSVSEILTRLNEKSGTSKKWSFTTVYSMLKNPVYRGDRAVGRSVRALYKGQKGVKAVPPDEWYVTHMAHEPLVSAEVFEKVQTLMRSASDTYAEKLAASQEQRSAFEDLFRGRLYCAGCGGSVHFHRRADSRGSWFAYYICGTYANRGRQFCSCHYIRQEELESSVLRAIQLHIEAALDYEALIDRLRNTAQEKSLRHELNSAVKSVSAKLRGLSSRRNRLYEDYTEGLLSEEEYAFAKTAYDGQYEQLNRQLEELTERGNAYTEIMSPDNRWIRMMKGIRDADTLTRELVNAVIDKILIHEDKTIELYFKYHDIYELTVKYLSELKGGESA